MPLVFSCARHHVLFSLIQFIIYFQFKTFDGIEKKNMKRLKNWKSNYLTENRRRRRRRQIIQSEHFPIDDVENFTCISGVSSSVSNNSSFTFEKSKTCKTPTERPAQHTHTHTFSLETRTHRMTFSYVSHDFSFVRNDRRCSITALCVFVGGHAMQPSRKHRVKDGFAVIHVSARIRIERDK